MHILFKYLLCASVRWWHALWAEAVHGERGWDVLVDFAGVTLCTGRREALQLENHHSGQDLVRYRPERFNIDLCESSQRISKQICARWHTFAPHWAWSTLSTNTCCSLLGSLKPWSAWGTWLVLPIRLFLPRRRRCPLRSRCRPVPTTYCPPLLRSPRRR